MNWINFKNHSAFKKFDNYASGFYVIEPVDKPKWIKTNFLKIGIFQRSVMKRLQQYLTYWLGMKIHFLGVSSQNPLSLKNDVFTLETKLKNATFFDPLRDKNRPKSESFMISNNKTKLLQNIKDEILKNTNLVMFSQFKHNKEIQINLDEKSGTHPMFTKSGRRTGTQFSTYTVAPKRPNYVHKGLRFRYKRIVYEIVRMNTRRGTFQTNPKNPNNKSWSISKMNKFLKNR